MNVVQAHNSANALEVGEAMKQHADMGVEGKRLIEEQERQRQQAEQRQQQEEEQQRQKQANSSGNVGGTAYVAKGSGQASNGVATQEKVRFRSMHAVL